MQQPLAPGTMVGDYEVVRPLGAGGMGEVYEAVHPVIGKRAAVKVMIGSPADSLGEARRLLEEARAVNAIRHPGIVDIFGAAVLPDGRPCLLMELLEGETIAEHLRAHGPLGLERVFWMLEGILGPLAAAHRAGIIHRDLKTSNVFLAETAEGQRVKLLDFGIARRLHRVEALTMPEVTLGSLGFMSPEQLAGEPVPQSDLYSVGCVAWLLITGQPVFGNESPAAVVAQHVARVPPSLRSLRREVSLELDAWVHWLLEKDTEERPFSAVVALATLREAAALTLSDATVGPDVDFMSYARKLDAKARAAASKVTQAPPEGPRGPTDRLSALSGARPPPGQGTRQDRPPAPRPTPSKRATIEHRAAKKRRD